MDTRRSNACNESHTGPNGDQHFDRTMQPTVPSWAWVSWERRARTRAGDYPRAHDRNDKRRQHDKYAFYGLRKDGRHFIRLDPLGKSLLLNRQWPPTSAPVTWRVDPLADTDLWRVPDIKSIQSYRPYEPVSIVLPANRAGASHDGGTSTGWSSAARGWAAGAVLLALLVLIVRAAENCLHKRIFKAIYLHTNVGAGEAEREMMREHYQHEVRRQESDEWSTPNVTATSQQHNPEVGSLPRLDDSDAFSETSHLNNDLPPPYSECASSNNNLNKYISEEPPPPYSACYVTYSNPDGIPAVHIHSRRRLTTVDERAHSSTEIDNVQNDIIENRLRIDTVAMTTGANNSENTDPGTGTELVFDNGRIVERISLDVNSNSDGTVTSNDNAGEARHADVKDRVVYIDETVSENTAPGRALLA